jgi:hypothetical protein
MIIFLMGATCAGKSTLIEHVRDLPDYGVVEVGKALRKKYGEDYFKGQAAPDHTEQEAWNIMLEGIDINADKPFTLIDGQPRTEKQAYKSMHLPWRKLYVHLWAPNLVRCARSYQRDHADEAKLRLSQNRITGDLPALYNVLTILTMNSCLITHFDTSSETYNPTFVPTVIAEHYKRSYQ